MHRTESGRLCAWLRFLTSSAPLESAELNQEEAAEMLGMSERTFRRWSAPRYEDGRRGRACWTAASASRSGRASAGQDRADEVERLYRERYARFTAKHFHEHVVSEHKFAWGYTWTKTFLQGRGLLARAERRGAHRRKRPRRPMAGMMLHQDALAARLARGPAGP